MTFQKLENLLPKAIRKANIEKQVTAAIVCNDFTMVVEAVIGKNVAAKARPLHIKNGILTVAVLSSVLAQEIKLHEPLILEKLNEGRKDKIERIRFIL
ncbi:DUF721 domain-containing protein [Candidatus Parcubacteria bacterium]|nr:MAG: DUF721 domain-containing protein [Candidatus Parcubacteria bacterium]